MLHAGWQRSAGGSDAWDADVEEQQYWHGAACSQVGGYACCRVLTRAAPLQCMAGVALAGRHDDGCG